MDAVKGSNLLGSGIPKLAGYPHLTKVDPECIAPDWQPPDCSQGFPPWKGQYDVLVSVGAKDLESSLVVCYVDSVPRRFPPFAHIEVRIGARSIVTGEKWVWWSWWRNAPEALDIDGSRVNCIHLPYDPMEPDNEYTKYWIWKLLSEPIINVMIVNLFLKSPTYSP